MALKAGRVGVAPSEVDEQGHIVGGGGGSSYTKAETDALLATKANKSTLTANNKEFNFAYDATSQKYGYKAGADGEFVPFEGAGGGQGLVLDNLITTGLTFTGCNYVKGGYQIIDGILYIDITFTKGSSSNMYVGPFPAVETPRAKGGMFINTIENVAQLDNFITGGGEYDTESIGLNSEFKIYKYHSESKAFRCVIIGDHVVTPTKTVKKSTKSTKSTKSAK